MSLCALGCSFIHQLVNEGFVLFCFVLFCLYEFIGLFICWSMFLEFYTSSGIIFTFQEIELCLFGNVDKVLPKESHYYNTQYMSCVRFGRYTLWHMVISYLCQCVNHDHSRLVLFGFHIWHDSFI